MNALALTFLIGALPFQAPPPYEVLPVDAGLANLESKLAGKQGAVWLEGDVLVFIAKGKDPMQVTGGIQMPLKQIPGTDLWIARLRMEGWDNAIVSYAFLGSEFRPGIQFSTWRGSKAPAEPSRVPQSPAMQTIQVKSKSLGESRTVTVYLPPGAQENIPAIVMADGGGAQMWAMSLEKLILDGKVRPTAIIGIHSGVYHGDRSKPYDPDQDFRAREYLFARDEVRFSAHLKWVTDELLPEMSRRFGISTLRDDLAVAGFSNGGAFAATAAAKAHRTFGAAIPLSVGIPALGEKPAGPLPRFFFAAGRLEASFLKGTRQAYETVKDWGAEAEIQTYTAGHDPILWETAFVHFIQKIFPPRAAKAGIHPILL